jgi:phytoene dehydrogenase-like protein
VRGGLGALTAALADAARAAGAAIRLDAGVARILVRDGRATGVALESGEEIPARLVVSSADPKRTLLGLVEPDALDPEFADKVRAVRAKGAAAKVNLALERLPAFTALAGRERPEAWLAGRLHLGPDLDYLERAADAVKYGETSAEPWLDVTIPSIADPSLAPSGGHVLSAWVQCAPYRSGGGDPAVERDRLGDLAIRTLARYAPDLAGLVVARQIITPADLEAEWALTGGHVFQGEPALDQLFVARPVFGWARYRTPVGGLYLCGAGTHPGGGVTGAPGANAAREILRDLRRTR